VLGLNWRATFVVSLLISVFSFHLFFNPSHHNLFRHRHFFPSPEPFRVTCYTGACDVTTYAVRSRNAAPHDRPASLCVPAHRLCPGSSLRLTKKRRSQATRQQPAKKGKETKQRKTKDKKKDRGTIRSAVFAPYCFGLAACLSPPLPFFFLSLFLLRTCDQQRL
jgi:hypothetical protein